MNIMNICKRISLCFVTALLLVPLSSAQVDLQSLGLTPAQLERLQSLSASERQALLNSANIGRVAQPSLEEPTDISPRSTLNASPSAIERSSQSQAGSDEIPNQEEGGAATPTDQLKQFGYELFAGYPTTFAPATDIPVPATYIMGPGDTVVLQLYGQQNVTYELVVTREGMLLFPEIGPIAVAGLNFNELRQQIDEIVSTQLIGQRAAVTLGSLRSIRIFVLGEAYRPGSYTVSALSTMTNALFVSGGITNVGSLRQVQLRREGETVAELDLYDLLLRGDTSADQRLMPDDVLFIPPIGRTVAVSGEVIRPAIYELRNEVTAEEVLSLAGGLLPTAYPRASKIERIDEQGLRTVLDVDFSTDSDRQAQVQNGDRIEINSVLNQLENVVITEGHLQRPGGFRWRDGMRVSDVIPSVSALLPNPDLEYALIVRQQAETRASTVVKLDLGNAIANPDGAANLALEPNDRIVTFGSAVGREEVLSDLLEELRAQASFNNPAAIVSIDGNVRFPGEYPYVEGMTVGDMLRSAGGMLERTDANYSLLIRKRGAQGAIVIEDAIANSLSIQSTKSASRGDTLLVFSANESRQTLLEDVLEQLKLQSDSVERSRVVRASGQVRFPGEYPLYDGMTVEGLVRAAGGFTESALTTEAELTRYYVVPGSGRQVDHVSVDLQGNGSLGQNLRLAEFDNLVVRQLPNWTESETITISGEVVSPGTYSIAKGDTLSSVLRRAGGLTTYADANASVLLRETLREQERELLEQYQQELESDIAAVALEEEGNEQAEVLAVGENLLEQVENVEPLGRLVIDLPQLISGNIEEDVLVRDGDQLFLPRVRQEVSILGEVNYPTSHLFNPELSVGDYINLSGGLTQRSDESRTYIIKSNGQVVSYSNARWFFQRDAVLSAGDTIVVPFDVEPTNYLVTWTSISTILFNLATSILAIESVGN